MLRFTLIETIKFNKNFQHDKKYILRSDKMSAKREIPEIEISEEGIEIIGDRICIDEKEYVDSSSEDYWKHWRD